MKILIALSLTMATVSTAQARVRNVLNCADEYTSVQIDTTGVFQSEEYQVVIKDFQSGEEYPYRTTLKDDSFVSVDGSGPTINTSPTSIAFVKSGWGLVVIEDCVFDF